MTTCAECGKEFVANRPNKKFCSPRCRQDNENKHSRLGPIQKACVRCGAVFQTINGVQKFCSPVCRQRATLDKQLAPPISERECRKCKKVFKPAHHAEQFCSDECRYLQKLTVNKRYFRRPEPPAQRGCAMCSRDFMPLSPKQKYCDRCGIKRREFWALRRTAVFKRRLYSNGLIEDDEV
jgi:hypothetical protein